MRIIRITNKTNLIKKDLVICIINIFNIRANNAKRMLRIKIKKALKKVTR